MWPELEHPGYPLCPRICGMHIAPRGRLATTGDMLAPFGARQTSLIHKQPPNTGQGSSHCTAATFQPVQPATGSLQGTKAHAVKACMRPKSRWIGQDCKVLAAGLTTPSQTFQIGGNNVSLHTAIYYHEYLLRL
eukprot:361905-Chlamydomonas_euryale.AAC.3